MIACLIVAPVDDYDAVAQSSQHLRSHAAEGSVVYAATLRLAFAWWRHTHGLSAKAMRSVANRISAFT